VDVRGEAVTIGHRYRGPIGAANGGYVAGVLAGAVGATAVEVSLRAPTPLDVPLELRRDDGRVLLLDGETLIAEARAAEPPAVVPPPPLTWEAAVDAARGARRPTGHFAECFVCGSRPERDSLEIHAGEVGGGGLVAAPWLAAGVGAEVVWAAIDCPGAFALGYPQRGEALLARITAEVRALPAEGERCIVAGWPLAEDGRKLYAGTALYGADGGLLAAAHQLWVVPRGR